MDFFPHSQFFACGELSYVHQNANLRRPQNFNFIDLMRGDKGGGGAAQICGQLLEIYTMTKTRLLYFGTDPYQTHPILTEPIFSKRLRFVVIGSRF